MKRNNELFSATMGFIYILSMLPIIAIAQYDPVTGELIKQSAEKAFGVNPDNVVQIAFGLMVTMLIVFAIIIYKMFNIITRTQRDDRDKMIGVINEDTRSRDEFKDELSRLGRLIQLLIDKWRA